MEPSSSCCTPSPSPAEAAARRRPPGTRRVRKQELAEVLEQVQRAIEMLRGTDADLGVPLSEVGAIEAPPESGSLMGSRDDGDDAVTSWVASDSDYETAQLCDLLKSKVELLEFLQNLNGIQKSVYQNGAVGTDTSWDIIKAVDYWEDDSSDDGYILVNQEDVVDGITSFMAAYLLSLKETKELSPDQLQKALQKTFSVQKRKSKIRKAWDGTKVIYNVASWGATAVVVYNNRAILAAAATAVQTSFRSYPSLCDQYLSIVTVTLCCVCFTLFRQRVEPIWKIGLFVNGVFACSGCLSVMILRLFSFSFLGRSICLSFFFFCEE